MRKLIIQTTATFVIGSAALGALLFLAAGTLDYWQAWVFIILLMALISEQGVYLALKDPELLERRKKIAQEGESRAQRLFIIVGLLANLCLLVVSALDHRFGWSDVPPIVALLGDGLIVLSFVTYHVVFSVNSYTASSIQTFEGQQVISTGPYAFVRHPKYVGDLFLVIGIPLALGSWWGLVFVIFTLLALAWRILDEEKLLKNDLPGYVEYTQKVRYRLVPRLW